MRDREDFVLYAAVKLMHPSQDEGSRKRNAVAAKASAEALADELGVGAPTQALEAQGAGEEIRRLALALEASEADVRNAKANVRDIQAELTKASARIVELEQDLERATAPKGRTR